MPERTRLVESLCTIRNSRNAALRRLETASSTWLSSLSFLSSSALRFSSSARARRDATVRELMSTRRQLKRDRKDLQKLISAADLAKIADLPPFEALRSQLLGLLKSNAAAFVRVLDAKVKKEQPAAPAA